MSEIYNITIPVNADGLEEIGGIALRLLEIAADARALSDDLEQAVKAFTVEIGEPAVHEPEE